MIFWILLTAAILAVLATWFVTFWFEKRYYWQTLAAYTSSKKSESGNPYAYRNYPYDDSSWAPTLWSIPIAAAILGVATVILMSLVYPLQTGGVMTSEVRKPLKALSVTDSVTGRHYFLAGGYVEGHPAYNYYVRDDDGAYLLKQARNDMSKLYEDTESNPYVLERNYDFYAAWLIPWNFTNEPRYEFHVPEGSVSDNIHAEP